MDPERGEPSFNPRSWVAQPTSPQGEAKSALKDAKRPAVRRTVTAFAATIGVIGVTAAMVHGLKPRPRPHAQIEPHQAPLRRTMIVPSSSELGAALQSMGVAKGEADAASVTAQSAKPLASGPINLTIILNRGALVNHLESAHLSDGSAASLDLTRSQNGGFSASRHSQDLAQSVKVIRGEMDGDSFYSSAVAAGVTDRLIPLFAQAFSFDFDFQREIKRGDIFEAAFTERAGEEAASDKGQALLFVLIETAAKSKALYRFKPAGEAEGWFDANGVSVIRSLMKTPVDGARVSSGFGMRNHPILGFMKMHTGVDFASPVGTAVYAAGNGTLEFAGPKGPNGNFIQIAHPNGWQTLYLHLNSISPSVKVGAQVRQGQQIGEVGTTGRSTGPHLHFEVHISGKPVDPSSVKPEGGETLRGAQLSGFIAERNRIDGLRALQTGG